MGAERIRTLLHLHRDRFAWQLEEALDRGWAIWTKQAAELLNTFRTNQENRLKEGKGFYKLNEESISLVHEDLMADYQTLAEHHFEEVVQLLEDYGAAELEVAGHLQ